MSENSKEIVDDKYEIEKQIGYGAFGDIYLVKNINDNKYYALKLLSLKRASKKDIILFQNEINILKRLSELDTNNKYISKYIANGKGEVKKKGEKTEDPILRPYLVLNYFENRNLFYYMEKKKDGFDEIYAKIIFKKILEGIQFCHKNNICHLDIKTENILLDSDFNPIIIDFGLSTESKDSSIKINGVRGTLRYLAPEMISEKKLLILNGVKADIYSLGILLFNLITGKYCFTFANYADNLYKYIIEKNYELFWTAVKNNKTNKILSDEFKKLYVKMVAKNPNERPSIEDILNTEWMKESGKLDEDKHKIIENDLREEFLSLRQNIEDDNNEEIEVEPRNVNNNNIVKKSISDTQNYFDPYISPKKFEKNEFTNHIVKIKGYLNPVEFMDTLINLIINDFDNITFSKENLSFRAIFEPKQFSEIYKSDDNEENDEEKEDEENEEYEYNYGRICIINISLVELKKNEYYIQFLKEKGELGDYYEKFLKIKNIIKKIAK